MKAEQGPNKKRRRYSLNSLSRMYELKMLYNTALSYMGHKQACIWKNVFNRLSKPVNKSCRSASFSARWFLLTLRVMGQGEQAHTGGAGSRTEHGDPVWVPAESCNVLLHPPKGLDLIQQAIIPFRRLVTCAEKSCTGREREEGKERESKIFCKKLTM